MLPLLGAALSLAVSRPIKNLQHSGARSERCVMPQRCQKSVNPSVTHFGFRRSPVVKSEKEISPGAQISTKLPSFKKKKIAFSFSETQDVLTNGHAWISQAHNPFNNSVVSKL